MVELNLDEIMSDLRKRTVTSNIIDIELKNYLPKTTEKYLSYLIEKLPNTSNKQYVLNFDPAENIVLNKFVSDDMLNKKFNVEENDFFKAVIAVDYYCDIMARSYSVVDSMYSFAKELEKSNPDLDPRMDSLVELLIEDSFKNNLSSNLVARIGAMRRVYNSKNNASEFHYTNVYKPNPIIKEAGKLISNSVNNLQDYIFSTKGNQDVKALIFTDSLYLNVHNQEIKDSIKTKLDESDFLKASILALQGSSKKYFDEKFQSILGKMM